MLTIKEKAIGTSGVIIRQEFDTVGEWIDHCEVLGRQGNPAGVDNNSFSTNVSSNDFYGCTGSEALRLAREGWPKGRAFMSDTLAASVAVMKQSVDRFQALDVGGQFPMVPVAVTGEPLCMATIGDDEKATKPIIRFVCEQWGSCGVDKANLTRRGAAILAHIDRLEGLGFRCEIVARFSCSGTVDPYCEANCIVDVMVKSASEPLDVDRVAFVLAHPAALRRLFFRQLETFPDGFHKPFHKYCGMPPKAAARHVEAGEVFLPTANDDTAQYVTVEKATAHIAKLTATALEDRPDCQFIPLSEAA